MLAMIFGVIAIFTSCLVMMQAVREIFWWDFKINKNIAWAFCFILPVLLYLGNFTDLTAVISITGAVMGASWRGFSFIVSDYGKTPGTKISFKNFNLAPLGDSALLAFCFGVD